MLGGKALLLLSALQKLLSILEQLLADTSFEKQICEMSFGKEIAMKS